MTKSETTIAFFDPFSGAAGDMVLGALIDAGLPLEELRTALKTVPIEGYAITAERVEQHGLDGIHFDVEVGPDQPQRDWATIKPMLRESGMPEQAKRTALAIFSMLAEAEAAVHGMPVERVHFHEVGAVDAIVDICGCALALELMGIEEVYSLPPVTGDGWVRAQHGLMPIPAPATAELLVMGGVPMGRSLPDGEQVRAELLTPTGAAILTTLATFEQPEFTPDTVGYGFGRKQLPWPNALRVFVGEMMVLGIGVDCPHRVGGRGQLRYETGAAEG